MEVELLGGLKLDLLTEHELRGALEDLRRGIASALRQCPISRHLSDAQTADASGNLVLDLGTPPNGFEWDVRRIMVNGEAPLTAVAGSGLVVIGAPGATGANALNVADFIPASTGFPSVAFYDPEQMIVGQDYHLLVACSGIVAGTRLFANASGLERDARQEQTPVPEYRSNGKAAR